MGDQYRYYIYDFLIGQHLLTIDTEMNRKRMIELGNEPESKRKIDERNKKSNLRNFWGHFPKVSFKKEEKLWMELF